MLRVGSSPIVGRVAVAGCADGQLASADGPHQVRRLGLPRRAAEEAGQPAEHGFTHIGLFLAWLIRHDLFDDSLVPAHHVEKVRDGPWEGSELRDDVDGKLIDDMLTPEGATFARTTAGPDGRGRRAGTQGGHGLAASNLIHAPSDPPDAPQA
jgi:hypothetical protein